MEERGSIFALETVQNNRAEETQHTAASVEFTCCRDETQEGSTPALCRCTEFYFERGAEKVPGHVKKERNIA